ncbi:MAG: hypothetical protein HY020_26455 [Burkholderiales bacterium]|nr:hypothetical protein [Burkholderiales bacterium]
MLLSHPYEGLRHDGVLYFGQAQLHSSVPALGHDVFFVAGSQDRYSIYAQLLGPLYGHLGRIATHVGALMLTWALLAGAVFSLLKRLEPVGQLSLWGLLAFAVMSPIYGGGWVFSYGAPFVTARSFAEPLLVWSLVALLAQRRLVAIALQVLAALFHPLMALPIIATTWCYLVESDRRWLWLLVALPAALLAAVFAIPPWDGLLKTFDPYWWSMVSSNPYLLMRNWTAVDLSTLVLDLAVLIAVTRLRPPDAWTRLIYAVIATTAAFIGLAALGVDLLHSVLLTQLQLWRAHWIAHLLAVALSPWLLSALWKRDGLWKVSACALGLALLNSHIGTDHGLIALTLWGVSSLAAWRLPRVTRPTVWLACACILLAMVGLSAHQLHGLLHEQAWQAPDASWSDRFIKFAAFPLIAAPCFAAILVLGRRRRSAWLALVLSALLLMASLMCWDQRSDLARTIDSAARSPHPFASRMPTEATVFWPNELAPVWGLLDRPSHYSQQQGAGVLFNRDTALIFGPRRDIYRSITEDQARCSTGARLARDRKALASCDMPAPKRLTALCDQHDAPDFLVLRGQLPLPPLATWQPPAKRDLPQTYALYACSQLTAREHQP